MGYGVENWSFITFDAWNLNRPPQRCHRDSRPSAADTQSKHLIHNSINPRCGGLIRFQVSNVIKDQFSTPYPIVLDIFYHIFPL